MSDPNATEPAEDLPVEGTALDGASGPVPAAGPAGQSTSAVQTGQPVPAGHTGGVQPEGPRAKGSQLQDLVDEPAKVMRIGTMMKQLLEEVKSAPLDEAARARLAEIHERSLKELEEGLAPELVEELERISLPFSEDATPSDAELRIAQAQLVGWLEGLFHGIQTALAAQHAAREHAAQRQLRELPPGTVIAPGVVIGDNGEPQRAGAPRAGAGHNQFPEPTDPDHGPGQYL
jgi:hypothetical protein